MRSVYSNLKLPVFSDRPFYYSNFVSTIDGKVQVLENTQEYWPLGSALDYQTLIELRTYADVIIHGKNTAIPHPTMQSLSKAAFWEARKKVGKNGPITYVVISNNPTEELCEKLLSNHENVKTLIITCEKIDISEKLENSTEIVRLGVEKVDLGLLSDFLFKRGNKHILVEGGPTLMGQFLKHDLVDEVFLTIAPKIVGNKNNTLTMVENELLSPERVAEFRLLSNLTFGDEIYLRYAKK